MHGSWVSSDFTASLIVGSGPNFAARGLSGVTAWKPGAESWFHNTDEAFKDAAQIVPSGGNFGARAAPNQPGVTAWNFRNGGWVSSDFTASDIVGSDGNFAAIGPSGVTAWEEATDSWLTADPTFEGPNKIKGSEGNFGAIGSKGVTVWSPTDPLTEMRRTEWDFKPFENAVDIFGSGGNFAAIAAATSEDNGVMAWNAATGVWVPDPTFKNPIRMVGGGGNFGAIGSEGVTAWSPTVPTDPTDPTTGPPRTKWDFMPFPSPAEIAAGGGNFAVAATPANGTSDIAMFSLQTGWAEATMNVPSDAFVELVSSGTGADWNFLFHASDPLSLTSELVAVSEETKFHFLQLEGAIQKVRDLRGTFVVFGGDAPFTNPISIAGFSSATGWKTDRVDPSTADDWAQAFLDAYAPVPEPASLSLLCSALLAFFLHPSRRVREFGGKQT